MSEQRPRVNQHVFWLQSRKWGGKQNQPATYICDSGKQSARIRLDDGQEKIVRLSSLHWEQWIRFEGQSFNA